MIRETDVLVPWPGSASVMKTLIMTKATKSAKWINPSTHTKMEGV